ncbi:MAG: hypothetical protein OES38_03860 [Gammaproteobacteria bacterium]|nr:hypothetical protein [Gammaproteobacteria bacterium]
MDQQHWDSEDLDEAFETTDIELSPDTFYVALKLALARLKEYSAATTG